MQSISNKVVPGTYIVAVSGGVDSMVLLDMLRRLPGLQLIIAHFDHGIRLDTAEDRLLIERYGLLHNLKTVYGYGHLGPNVSEEQARKARYAFLEDVREQYQAIAVITGHHQDDVVETALINMVRGTGRRGLTALQSRVGYMRPLLAVPKSRLVAYASIHQVPWREDTTNTSGRYLRNRIRKLLLEAGPDLQKQLLKIIVRQRKLNAEIDTLLEELANMTTDSDTRAAWRRAHLTSLPFEVAAELLHYMLRTRLALSAERQQIMAILQFIRMATTGKKYDLNSRWWLRITRTHIIIDPQQKTC